MRRHVSSLAAAVIVCAAGAWGQDVEPAEMPPPDPPAATDDGPPEPKSDDFDWMQFNNGEWLKGEIKDIQDDNLTFDSDELDELSLDLSDVHIVHSSQINTIVLKDKTTVQGPFTIDGDIVTVHTSEGPKTFHRDEVRGIIPGALSELNFWSGKLSLGGTIRSGNVNQTDLNMFFRAQRRAPGLRLVMEYAGAYGELEGVKSANNHRFFLTNDVYLTPAFFLRLPQIELFSDEFQNIDYRVTPGLLAGYDVVDKSDLEWTVSGGLGYQYTKFNDPAPGSPEVNDSAVFLFSTRVDWEATPRIDLFGELGFAAAISGRTNNTSRLTLGTEIEVWGSLDFDITFILDRQSNPAADSTGEVPLQNDVRIVFALGFDF